MGGWVSLRGSHGVRLGSGVRIGMVEGGYFRGLDIVNGRPETFVS